MGPDMTPEIRARLEAEIASFDLAATKARIEKAARPAPDRTNAYEEWVETEGGGADANDPDAYSDPMVWGKAGAGRFSADVEIGRAEFYELLTPAQFQVWNLVMVNGLTQADAARKLRISQPTVSHHLAAAMKKLKGMKS